MGIKIAFVCDGCAVEAPVDLSCYITTDGHFNLRLPEYHTCSDCKKRRETVKEVTKRYHTDSDGYIALSTLAHGELEMPTTIVAWYAVGAPEYPDCGEGLRLRNIATPNPPGIRIHIKDAKKFIKRVRAAKA